MDRIFYYVMAILVVALVTLFTRAMPFLLFGRQGQIPQSVAYLGQVMPPAIIVMLIIYCIRNAEFLSFPFGFPEIFCSAIAAALHILKGNTMISIAVSTIIYMILVQNL